MSQSSMSPLSGAEIRHRFVEYFKKQGHEHVQSSSLIPEDDPTLLFANAGMNQFKNAFLGIEQRPNKRAVSVQKCVRAGGKHNDLENVGFTARHHTFFEMLGNFSFGDYFKKDAIHFAWEFLTKDLGIPKEKLYVTVFQDDDEAADIWHKQEAVSRDRIFRLGEKDNFWRMGDTGPCGPCSEIFYDHGPKAGKISDPFKGIVAGEDRFVEIWNLVFMQFFEKSPGQMEPLPKPSVDTGSGLERVAAALQSKFNNYDTDLFYFMMEKSCQMVGWNLPELLAAEDALRTNPSAGPFHGRSAQQVRENLAALRVMADHVRASSFLIADGARPANEGRGYVLRRILRRGIRFGRKISTEHAFLPTLSEALIHHMSAAYPELARAKDIIVPSIRDEEQRFLQTLDTGTELLSDEIKKLTAKNGKKLSSDFVFKLYDTFGFPYDLTNLMAAEHGLSTDESEFNQLMERARKVAQASWKGKAISLDETHLQTWAQKFPATRFVGYEHLFGEAKILGLSDGKQEVQALANGADGFVVTDVTPFYGESGGQAGDRGRLTTDQGDAHVANTTKINQVFVHQVQVNRGTLTVSPACKLQVESLDRRRTANNHSATHLLHAALRKVLGTHVTQAGSLVDATKLRFDFSHSKALSRSEIQEVETLVNEQIARGLSVEPTEMGYKEAIANGAMALFGEKYGDKVRVLKMGDFSVELCGGTHVENTAQIRMCKIVSESGVSAGVRRIEALTGDLAFEFFCKHTEENQRARAAAGITENWMGFLESKTATGDWIESAKAKIKELEREVRQGKAAKVDLDKWIAEAVPFSTKSGPQRLVAVVAETEDRDMLAQWADQLKNKIETGAIVLAGRGSGSSPIVVTLTRNLVSELSAGTILKNLAQQMGGKGGGRPDFAQGAVPSLENWEKAREALLQSLRSS